MIFSLHEAESYVSISIAFQKKIRLKLDTDLTLWFMSQESIAALAQFDHKGDRKNKKGGGKRVKTF